MSIQLNQGVSGNAGYLGAQLGRFWVIRWWQPFAPGFIETPMTAQMTPEAVCLNVHLAMGPLRRWGQPAEIALLSTLYY